MSKPALSLFATACPQPTCKDLYANGHENENGLSCKHAHWYGTLTRQGVHVLMEMAVSIMSVEPSGLQCTTVMLHF